MKIGEKNGYKYNIEKNIVQCWECKALKFFSRWINNCVWIEKKISVIRFLNRRNS